ncbi:hypothetical protein Tco_0775763 [Tanacetum coccineum]|uniref:Uncharacterized protein n=1 Tax=Tanacetum coccineum TaxID=301880 RepID=A0ABQ5EAE8_9ASTR
MVNTRTDAELAAAVQAAVDAMLPQIREQKCEVYTLMVLSGGNPPPATFIYGLIASINRNTIRSKEQAKEISLGLHSNLDSMSCSILLRMMSGWDKRHKSGDRYHPYSQQVSIGVRKSDDRQKNDRQGSDRQGSGGNYRNNNNNNHSRDNKQEFWCDATKGTEATIHRYTQLGFPAVQGEVVVCCWVLASNVARLSHLQLGLLRRTLVLVRLVKADKSQNAITAVSLHLLRSAAQYFSTITGDYLSLFRTDVSNFRLPSVADVKSRTFSKTAFRTVLGHYEFLSKEEHEGASPHVLLILRTEGITMDPVKLRLSTKAKTDGCDEVRVCMDIRVRNSFEELKHKFGFLRLFLPLPSVGSGGFRIYSVLLEGSWVSDVVFALKNLETLSLWRVRVIFYRSYEPISILHAARIKYVTEALVGVIDRIYEHNIQYHTGGKWERGKGKEIGQLYWKGEKRTEGGKEEEEKEAEGEKKKGKKERETWREGKKKKKNKKKEKKNRRGEKVGEKRKKKGKRGRKGERKWEKREKGEKEKREKKKRALGVGKEKKGNKSDSEEERIERWKRVANRRKKNENKGVGKVVREWGRR